MSYKAMDLVYSMDIADPVAKFVLLTIAKHADDKMQAWPSAGRIGKLTGLSPRTVQRKIVELRKGGFLFVSSRRQDGKKTSNLYRVLKPKGLRQSDVTIRQGDVTDTTECRINISENKSENILSSSSDENENEIDWSGFKSGR
jgi:biotin operon repressor